VPKKLPLNKSDWPADKVERRPVDSLTPYAKNARTHSEAQVAQIAASIKEYGFTVPVLIDPRGNVIAGHGRLMAAKLLGLADVPVMVADGWSATKRRAYVILDNKLALNSGWDPEILRAEFADLAGEGFDLGGLGFDPGELAEVSGAAPPPGIEDAPESNYKEQYGVIVVCADEAQQQLVYAELQRAGHTVKVVVT
jgi:ParB-like chromosome segregation protein Spo0J